MMQEASGEGNRDQALAPPATPNGSTSLLDPNYILYLPSELNPEQPFSLLPHLKGYFCPFPSILYAYLKHDGHDASNPTIAARYRARLFRHLQKLAQFGIIDFLKLEYSIHQIRLTSNGLNLIQAGQNSNSRSKARPGLYDLPKKASPARMTALRLTMRHRMIEPRHRDIIADKFFEYVEDVEEKRILMTYRGFEKSPDAPILILPYKTRFTSKSRKYENLVTFENIWKGTILAYKSAVMLTLTTDPKRFPSAFHANKHFQKSLNRFWSYLTKKKHGRPKYLNVHEFTKNGLLHAHIIIYGLNWLMDYKQLSERWSKCNQGEIVHIFTLHNNGNKWLWTKNKPKDAGKQKSPLDYLKKYLKKALYSNDQQELYWTFNKRYFTYARSLKPVTAKSEYEGPPLTCIGAAPSDMISIILERRSRAIWSQIKKAEWSNSNGPPTW